MNLEEKIEEEGEIVENTNVPRVDPSGPIEGIEFQELNWVERYRENDTLHCTYKYLKSLILHL